MGRARAGGASLAAALLSMLATTPGVAETETLPGAPSPSQPGPSTALPPARPSLELVPSHPDAQLRAPDAQGTQSQDRDFARTMRRVYQDGMDAAELQIANGRSTRLKAMARRVLAANRQDMADLDKWAARQKLRVTQSGPAP